MPELDTVTPASPPAPGSASVVAAPPPPKPQGGLTAVAIALLTAIMLFAGVTQPGGRNVLIVAAAMILILWLVGQLILQEPLGVLINSQNVMSLARLQMAVWTVVVGASYFTYAIARAKAHMADPLNVTIDWPLWALMGISTSSLVGSAMISSNKRATEPDEGVVQKTAEATAEKDDVVEQNRQGLLYANTSKQDASVADLFQGDELGNTTHIDLAKVQLFLFTLITAVAFMATVYKTLHGPNPDLTSLPVLPEGMLAILGISHAGYLTNKSINHTSTQ